MARPRNCISASHLENPIFLLKEDLVTLFPSTITRSRSFDFHDTIKNKMQQYD